ncbi:N-acetyltransferase family protein [Flavobacterium sp. 3HN19-14]|uniref:GNAT family N-acetyltransferase n=1 Tax=Flavobacterium sp. 3HN19-14 TaxID=3448133 RepID=UPI003EE098EE
MEVNIREAKIEDVSAILKIVNFSIQNSTAIYDYEPRDLQQQLQWFDEKKTSGFPVFVTENEGKIAGFGQLWYFSDKGGISIYGRAFCLCC